MGVPRIASIAAVLGHEVAHIFLHRWRLSLPGTLPNEILTDTTAALYGFGALMADTFNVSWHREQVSDDLVRVTRKDMRLPLHQKLIARCPGCELEVACST